MKTEHILIIRFSALGDVAMTVPVVYSLAKQYPDVRITMLSKPFARPLFEDLAPNVGFMEADLANEYHGLKGLNALYRRLTAKNFTAIADLHNVIRSVAHLDKHRLQRRQLVSYNNKVLEPIPSAFDNYAKVFEQLGYPVHLEFTSLLTPEQAGLSQLPEGYHIKKPFQQWIGIAPFAAHRGKAYSLAQMEKVVTELTGRHPSAALGGMMKELVLMSHLDVMISMDSANMHLASLVATPVVSVWGATHPYAGFMGWGQSEDNAVQVDLPCRPCSIYGNKVCRRGDYACLSGIDPMDIVEKVDNILK